MSFFKSVNRDSKYDIKLLLEILPHRYPFLLVDRIIDVSGGSATSRVGRQATAIKNFTFNEPFFQGHFPGDPVVPGVMIAEALAQTCVVAYYRDNDPIKKVEVAIAGLNKARFRRSVTPGDTMLMTAKVLKDRGQIFVIDCKAEVRGQLCAEVEILAKISSN